jgi:hypothetical protein
MLHTLQCPYTYAVNILSVSDVCYSKCFMLQVFQEQAWQGGVGEDGPLGRSGPCVRTGSKVGAAADAEHKAISMGVAAEAEHETASMGGQ